MMSNMGHMSNLNDEIFVRVKIIMLGYIGLKLIPARMLDF